MPDLTDYRGQVLKNKMDLDDLKNIEPKHFTDYIKFTVDFEKINSILFQWVKL